MRLIKQRMSSLLLCRWNSLADSIVGHSTVDGVSAIQSHPLVVLGTVDGDTVLLARALIGLPVHPVGVGEGLTAGVVEAALVVDIIGSKPVGGQASRHSIS